MKQYTNEHERAEALQQKVKELQQFVNTKDELLQQFQQKLHNTVPKLNIAINMLKNLESAQQRDRCLALLQQACAEEIALLNQIPNLEDLLQSENLEVLRQFNIVN